MSVSNQDDKAEGKDDGLEDLGIPVPIQTFLWGQIAPFIRPKLGKHHEATCVVCFSTINVFLQFGFNRFHNQTKLMIFILVLSTCAGSL